MQSILVSSFQGFAEILDYVNVPLAIRLSGTVSDTWKLFSHFDVWDPGLHKFQLF